MKTRHFGATQENVSKVGLGTWQFGGDWGELTDQTAMSIMQTAVERGVTFFDTANVYGTGRSEELIGEFIKESRAHLFIATKLGRLRGYPDDYSLDLFKQSTEESLKRLGVDRLDLTQLHCIPRHHLQEGKVFDWLRRLKEEGLIRYFGASVETVEEGLICLEQDDLASLQVIFNIFRQKPIDELFKKAKEKNVALIIRLPLASGLLAGKFTKDSTFSPQDHRSFNRNGEMFNVGETFAGLPFEKGVELSDQLKPFVPQNWSMAQFALRWILDFPEVSVIIPGASNTEHVVSNTSAGDLPSLSPEIHEQLRRFYQEHVKDHIRGAY
ncbi:MAG: aldo/keto reductase [candidate division KSB1 bacterium]|nr:aldo/keto reductase [candidate division KSB1 bacterium]